MDAILRFCKNFGISQTITAAYHPQSNGKAERVIQTLKNSMRKLQVTTREEWGRILQLATSSYRMVPHESTGFSPFLMMYGWEAIMPEETPHMTYLSNEDYETVVDKHIGRMLAINEKAGEKNQECVQRSKEYFDRKYVKKVSPHNFVVGDIVLMNIKKRIRDIKNVDVSWIGPCTMVYERPGKLFDVEYNCEGKVTKYLRVQPEFLKLYVRKVV